MPGGLEDEAHSRIAVAGGYQTHDERCAPPGCNCRRRATQQIPLVPGACRQGDARAAPETLHPCNAGLPGRNVAVLPKLSGYWPARVRANGGCPLDACGTAAA